MRGGVWAGVVTGVILSVLAGLAPWDPVQLAIAVLVAVVATTVAVRRLRSSPQLPVPRAWALMVAGPSLGLATPALFELVGGGTPGIPLGLIYLSTAIPCVLLLAGLWLLSRQGRRAPGRDTMMLDAGLLGVVLVILWVAFGVIDGAFSDLESWWVRPLDGMVVAVNGLSVAIAARLAIALGTERGRSGMRRATPVWLLTASAAALFAFDAFGSQMDRTLAAAGPSAGLAILGPVLLAAAVCHPAAADLHITDVQPRRALLASLVPLGVALLLPVVMLTVDWLPGGVGLDPVPLVVGWTVLGLLILMRVVILALDADRAMAALIVQARTDGLTGLANRAHLVEQLPGLLVHAARSGHQVGLLYLDLDGFKQVNDEHGHVVGDRLLMVIARRLLGAGVGRLAVRVGGDEFVVVLNPATAEALKEAAATIVEVINRPVEVDGAVLQISASIGWALAEVGDTDWMGLIARADEVMYTRKRRADGPDATLHIIELPTSATA